ncbi:hypothetical protein J008_01245 [Cryptococcus neoformans]|nr:hypothetical protein J008_01245 [Cryptococcus neoformans var. grubii]
MSQQILAKSHLNHIANKYDLHWGGRGRVSNDEAPKQYETVLLSYPHYALSALTNDTSGIV